MEWIYKLGCYTTSNTMRSIITLKVFVNNKILKLLWSEKIVCITNGESLPYVKVSFTSYIHISFSSRAQSTMTYGLVTQIAISSQFVSSKSPSGAGNVPQSSDTVVN